MSDYPERIMHADDDPEIRDLIVEAFSIYDDVVLESCENGQDLLDKAPDFAPEIILLDLKMEGGDGIDAIEEMRSGPNPLEAPVVFLTGYEDVKMIPQYKLLGVIGIIHKPFSIGTLPERIRGFWQEYTTGKELTL